MRLVPSRAFTFQPKDTTTTSQLNFSPFFKIPLGSHSSHCCGSMIRDQNWATWNAVLLIFFANMILYSWENYWMLWIRVWTGDVYCLWFTILFILHSELVRSGSCSFFFMKSIRFSHAGQEKINGRERSGCSFLLPDIFFFRPDMTDSQIISYIESHFRSFDSIRLFENIHFLIFMLL